MNVLFSIEVKISGIVIVAADMDKFVGGGWSGVCCAEKHVMKLCWNEQMAALVLL